MTRLEISGKDRKYVEDTAYDRIYDDQKRLIEYHYIDEYENVCHVKYKYSDNGYLQKTDYRSITASIMIHDTNNKWELYDYTAMFQKNGLIVNETICIYDSELFYEELIIRYNHFESRRDESYWRIFSKETSDLVKQIRFDRYGSIKEEIPENTIESINIDQKNNYRSLEKRFTDRIPSYEFDDDWYDVDF